MFFLFVFNGGKSAWSNNSSCEENVDGTAAIFLFDRSQVLFGCAGLLHRRHIFGWL